MTLLNKQKQNKPTDNRNTFHKQKNKNNKKNLIIIINEMIINNDTTTTTQEAIKIICNFKEANY